MTQENSLETDKLRVRRQYEKKYRDTHKKEIALSAKLYRDAHRKEIRLYNRLYYRKNRERINAYNRAFHWKNREEHNRQMLEWRMNNREKWLSIQRRYTKKNPPVSICFNKVRYSVRVNSEIYTLYKNLDSKESFLALRNKIRAIKKRYSNLSGKRTFGVVLSKELLKLAV